MKLHRQKGVAAVELALIIVPMLIMCFGIVEVGRALNYYNGLVKATRGAARYLTTKDLNDSSPTRAAMIAAAKNLAVCGTTIPCTGATQLVPGLTSPDQVSVTTTNNVQVTTSVGTAVGVARLVTVTISPVTFTSLLLPFFSINDFSYSPVKITMAWSVT